MPNNAETSCAGILKELLVNSKCPTKARVSLQLPPPSRFLAIAIAASYSSLHLTISISMYPSISVYLQYISKNAVTSCACVSETMHANISVHLTIIYLISSMSDVWFGLTPPTPPWPPRAQCISVNLGISPAYLAFMSPCTWSLVLHLCPHVHWCSMHVLCMPWWLIVGCVGAQVNGATRVPSLRSS